jgi:hypothetical protein
MWIKINGENNSHKCDLPMTIDGPSISATMLQKRHVGSIWQCSCNIKYEWSGKKWSMA